MTGMKLGQFVYGSSFIHALDPRTKILCCLLVIISVFLSYTWYYLLFYLLLMTGAILCAGLNLRFIVSSLLKLRYLLLFTFLFQAFLTPGQAVFLVGKLSMTREGLILGAVNISRLLILFLGSMVLLMTTSPLKLAAGIEFLLRPLSKLKIPIYNLTTILSISFRFLPILFEEAATIKNAQKSRGAPFDSPQIGIRIKAYTAILIPLFEASLARAADLGEAMESRCFTGHPNKLRLNSLKMTGLDILVLFLMVMLSFAGIIMTILME
ncbi:energy-coupling factor transport system permease protein [Desulfotomaculum arcticum]|uniref:Energy-coupling factor transport system permease protein n=1 Tax=Desulfotruncus arcticus DSM 17038 TaxID=1121424 RepID=A0A1I2R870_9FIRM|nr:energy-coupling factor transporter transmembrane component T [Desulfotruncus arcticus]SFG34807.1 energy-coupling factor transport system permease protein [Desulfotomaculum arcticum] [Desulfotruncus arcticus DSM 17038]